MKEWKTPKKIKRKSITNEISYNLGKTHTTVTCEKVEAAVTNPFSTMNNHLAQWDWAGKFAGEISKCGTDKKRVIRPVNTNLRATFAYTSGLISLFSVHTAQWTSFSPSVYHMLMSQTVRVQIWILNAAPLADECDLNNDRVRAGKDPQGC